jgi:hypothetical protein
VVKHITNGDEYLSVDTDGKCYTLEKICLDADYKLVQDDDFKKERRELIRSNEYRQKWRLPKKLNTITTAEEADTYVPKVHTRKAKLKSRSKAVGYFV